ncbi:MAG: hypothetical protein L0Z54_05655, partial [Thermoplasmata archaeon]|nr:hypothetical protein [Thermoplasmata archaeon]
YYRVGDSPEERVVEFEVRVLFPQELRLLVEHMGFEVLKVYGDYDLNPFGEDSPKQIVTCCPKAAKAGNGPAGPVPKDDGRRSAFRRRDDGEDAGDAGDRERDARDDEGEADDVNIDEIMRKHHGDHAGDDGWATS